MATGGRDSSGLFGGTFNPRGENGTVNKIMEDSRGKYLKNTEYGKIFGDETDLDSRARILREYMMNNFRDSSVVDGNSNPVNITKKGINKAISLDGRLKNNPDIRTVYQNSNAEIDNLINVSQKATQEQINRLVDNKAVNTDTNRDLSYNYARIQDNGADYEGLLNIANYKGGDGDVFYGMKPIKKSPVDGSVDIRPEALSETEAYAKPLSDSTIPQPTQKVNPYGPTNEDVELFKDTPHFTTGDRDNSGLFENNFDPRSKNGTVNKQFENVPLAEDRIMTKGNLYEQVKLGSAKGDLWSKPQKEGNWEYQLHNRKTKDGKKFSQFERRYVGDGEVGEWQPYSRALYIWKSQNEKIDAANNQEVIQDAIKAAREDGQIKDFVYRQNHEGDWVSEPIQGKVTLDGGFVRDPQDGRIIGNHIQVTPFGVVNQIAGKFRVVETDNFVSGEKRKSGITDTFVRKSEKLLDEKGAEYMKGLVDEKRQRYSQFAEELKSFNDEHFEIANFTKSFFKNFL